MKPDIEAARRRVIAAMEEQGLTQNDLVQSSGVEQSQVSKFLTGQRRRWSPPIERICQYAGIDSAQTPTQSEAEERLFRVLRRTLRDNPDGVVALTRVVHALAPIVESMRADHPKATR